MVANFQYSGVWGRRIQSSRPSWATSRPCLKKRSPVAHTCYRSYLGCCDLEDGGLRPAWANSSWEPIPKTTREKLTGGVAKVEESLLCKHKALSSNLSSTKKKKRKKERKGLAMCLTGRMLA
jgi:hypothetical protein